MLLRYFYLPDNYPNTRGMKKVYLNSALIDIDYGISKKSQYYRCVESLEPEKQSSYF